MRANRMSAFANKCGHKGVVAWAPDPNGARLRICSQTPLDLARISPTMRVLVQFRSSPAAQVATAAGVPEPALAADVGAAVTAFIIDPFFPPVRLPLVQNTTGAYLFGLNQPLMFVEEPEVSIYLHAGQRPVNSSLCPSTLKWVCRSTSRTSASSAFSSWKSVTRPQLLHIRWW